MLISWAIPHQEKRSKRLGEGVNCQLSPTISVSRPKAVRFSTIACCLSLSGKITCFFNQFQGMYI